MNNTKYILLLNDALKQHFVTASSQEKRRLKEKFEFLENGLWDAGVRVKKLQGLSRKVVFEARLSRGERILLTLGKHGQHSALYVWGIVKHDDITKAASAIVPSNVPFLNFEPAGVEEYHELSFDDLSDDYYSQEDIEQTSPEDYGPQKWLVLNHDEWERVLRNVKPDNFEIFLFLTSKQKKVLATAPPVLLSGTAGSGKTTISVYYLLRRDFQDKKRLFITYSPYLKQFSERIYSGLIQGTEYEESRQPDFYVFRDLLYDILRAHGSRIDAEKEVGLKEFDEIYRCHGLYKKYDTELVWEEIRSIIKGAKPPISVMHFKRLLSSIQEEGLAKRIISELQDYLLGLKNFELVEKIERFIEKKTVYANYDAFILNLEQSESASSGETQSILQEILKIIERKMQSFTAPLLTIREYILLGKKRAPHFLYDREEIYKIAEYYQNTLDERGLWDEIDLSKRALQLIGSSSDYTYDLVVCDEVQDFADVQLSLIFRFARSHRFIFLAGDMKQVINPSGFRWEEVRNKFYERGVQVPEVVNLNLNFRCVGNIVRLANRLLDLKRELVGLSGDEAREEWKFNGKPPFLIHGIPESEMKGQIMITGAGQIVLARSNAEQSKLKKALGTEMVFTVHEAKGLEFDTVMLWKFCQDKKSKEIWRKIKYNHHFDERQYPHIKHELNLLYVAVTRARNTLIIYDGSAPADIWETTQLQDLVYRTSERDALTGAWQHISSPSEWEEQGDYFFEREFYSAAVECYKNAGNITKKEIAEAFSLAGTKRPREAAALFENHGYIHEAAENYELSGDFRKAAALWEAARDRERARLCAIRLYEENGDYNRAADEWIALNHDENAVQNWKRADNFQKLADYHYEKRQYREAADYFKKAGDLIAAAGCHKKVKEFDKAANLYFKDGDYEHAASLYKKMGNDHRLLQCYMQSGDHYLAALLQEKKKDIQGAIESFRKFIHASEENKKRLLEEAKRFSSGRGLLKSAIRYSALSMYEKSASLFMKKKYYDRACEEFDILGDYQRKAECYEKQNKYYEAALELEKAEMDNKWQRVEEVLESYVYSNGLYDDRCAERLYREAGRFRQQGSHDRALVRYKAIDYPSGIYDVYLAMDRDGEALEYFLKNEMSDFANEYIANKSSLHLSSMSFRHLLQEIFYEYEWRYDEYPDVVDVLSQLFLMHLREEEDAAIRSLADDFISSLKKGIFYFDENVSDSLLDLILTVHNYNAIFQLISTYRYLRDDLPKKIASFLKKIEEASSAAHDKTLLACSLFLKDNEEFERILSELTLSGKNYELFAASKLQYRHAVEYLVSQKQFKEAEIICRIQRNDCLAGNICEETGDYRSAGRYYRDGGAYEDALRCFRIINDERAIARVYERRKQYREAIEIWKKIDVKREIARIEKKIAKEKAKKDQFQLFE